MAALDIIQDLCVSTETEFPPHSDIYMDILQRITQLNLMNSFAILHSVLFACSSFLTFYTSSQLWGATQHAIWFTQEEGVCNHVLVRYLQDFVVNRYIDFLQLKYISTSSIQLIGLTFQMIHTLDKLFWHFNCSTTWTVHSRKLM